MQKGNGAAFVGGKPRYESAFADISMVILRIF